MNQSIGNLKVNEDYLVKQALSHVQDLPSTDPGSRLGIPLIETWSKAFEPNCHCEITKTGWNEGNIQEAVGRNDDCQNEPIPKQVLDDCRWKHEQVVSELKEMKEREWLRSILKIDLHEEEELADDPEVPTDQ